MKTTLLSNNGKATQIRSTFGQTVAVQADIQAGPEIIWALLTNASDMTRWNSTLLSVQGEIAEGSKIVLKSTLDPKRSFKLKVTGLLVERQMTWQSGAAPFFKGERVFTLSTGEGTTRFTMSEKMGGLMFPLAAAQLPDFTASFEQFAADLKKEAELIAN